jgi:hypothetical protein
LPDSPFAQTKVQQGSMEYAKYTVKYLEFVNELFVKILMNHELKMTKNNYQQETQKILELWSTFVLAWKQSVNAAANGAGSSASQKAKWFYAKV